MTPTTDDQPPPDEAPATGAWWSSPTEDAIAVPPVSERPAAVADAASPGMHFTPLTVSVLVLIAAIIGGGIGGAAGVLSERRTTHQGALDPAATLGSGFAATPVDRSSRSVAAIAARLLPSVVTISVKSSQGEGTGSGVVLRSDGYILTNNHVVEAAVSGATLTAQFAGTRGDTPARIVGRDPISDLAVIKVSLRNLRPATLGKSSSLVVGDPVLAIGAPLGLSSTVTAGIVSALNRTVSTADDTGQRHVIGGAIQTDAAINPGNSGGALVDSLGQVIGINTAIASAPGGSGGSIGVGFAIPIDIARSVAEEIIRTGKVTHPYIGVTLDTVTADAARQNKLPVGAIVVSVIPGSPAAKAGLRARDIITGIDGEVIDSADALIVALRTHKLGDTVSLKISRNGADKTVTATLVDNPNQ